jgi:hypothetical protein
MLLLLLSHCRSSKELDLRRAMKGGKGGGSCGHGQRGSGYGRCELSVRQLLLGELLLLMEMRRAGHRLRAPSPTVNIPATAQYHYAANIAAGRRVKM